jgi:hypothetical protein
MITFRKLIFIAVFLTFCSTSNAQACSINSYGPLYDEILENEISGFVEGYKCKDVFLRANKGELIPIGECSYVFKIDSAETVVISIYIRGRKTKLASRTFPIHKIPPPFLRIGGKSNNDTISKNNLLAQGGVQVKFPNGILVCTDGLSYTDVSFTVSIINRENAIVGNYHNEGNKFTNKTRELLGKVEPGGQILVHSVSCKSYLGKTEYPLPLRLS